MTDRSTLENQVIAMSNTLAKKSTRFTVTQQKLFYVSIASLRNGLNENNEVINTINYTYNASINYNKDNEWKAILLVILELKKSLSN